MVGGVHGHRNICAVETMHLWLPGRLQGREEYRCGRFDTRRGQRSHLRWRKRYAQRSDVYTGHTGISESRDSSPANSAGTFAPGRAAISDKTASMWVEVDPREPIG